jgi:exodeoxyribonuclease V alpha subunit
VSEDRDARIARQATGLLREFNAAGIVTAADVHVAVRLGTLGGESEESTLLAAALAVRAPRLGHVCVDLATISSTASSDLDTPVDLQSLPWPSPDRWQALERSPLVGASGPLHLEGTTLYLDRYWSLECQVARDLLEKAEGSPEVDEAVLADGLDRLFPEVPDLQRLAAAAAVSSRLSVIAGGPGTGKTTTVARVLALLFEQAAGAGARPPLVGLAAPTGKAAARLQEAVQEAAGTLDTSPDIRARLASLRGTTVHRLLGYKPGNHSRFRHDRLNRLAHEVVVVDETSMVALSLMARLVEAVRPEARLVLVGDPEQLASVEAGAVLGDIVGPALSGPRMSAGGAATLSRRARQPVEAEPAGRIGDGIVVLERVHRFSGGIAELAAAIRAGDTDRALALLASGGQLSWIDLEAEQSLGVLRDVAVAAGRDVVEAARAGRAAEALKALARFRLLCAHRRGPSGASTWGAHVEGWMAAIGLVEDGPWYPGRPLLVTENDYSLRLFNGDTGVVVRTEPGRVAAAFERGGEIVEVSPTRLAAVDSVFAMTVHKSQGSQFDRVAVVLPPPDSPVLTRELLYTAVTRARQSVILAGSEDALRTAIGRPIARSSGLGRRLWGDGSVR